jgi:hypothetical protein
MTIPSIGDAPDSVMKWFSSLQSSLDCCPNLPLVFHPAAVRGSSTAWLRLPSRNVFGRTCAGLSTPLVTPTFTSAQAATLRPAGIETDANKVVAIPNRHSVAD